MTYCTSLDVKILNSKRDYDTSTRPTNTQLTSCIVWITAEMNVRMSAVGISVPISTSPATDISRHLKLINTYGAAGLVEESAFMGGNENESDHANSLTKKYEKALQAIEKKPNIITGLSGAILDSYEYSNSDKRRDKEPFERGKYIW